MAVPEAQEGQQAVDKAVETAILGSRRITGVANFGDAFKSWNPPEPQAWSKPSIWRENLVAGVSISGVVALGLRLDITDTGRLLWAVFGVFLLGWGGTTLTAERWASLRDARKFRPRRFEDFASWAFAITSIFTIATVGLTAHEPVRYLLRDALDFEILFVQLAATFSMIVARRT